MIREDWITIGAAALGGLVVARIAQAVFSGVRSKAMDACESVVPSDYGDSAFEVMTGGNYSPGFGSTCGFLCSYVLEQIGCCDGRILNRDVPACGLHYTPGDNISRLVNGAKALDAWRLLSANVRPSQGDIIFCSNGPPSTEHVFVFNGIEVDENGLTWWHSFDAGKTNAAGAQCAREDRRRLKFSGNGPESLAFIGGPRTIQGFIDLDAIPLS